MAYSAGVFFIDLESGSDAARTALTTCVASNPSGSVTRINKTAHGLTTGAVVDLTLFTAWLNAAWKITVVDADNFDLDGAVWQATADNNGTVTPRGGSSKADAWLTMTGGATAARIQPGDTIRIKATPSPTLVGTCGWTQNSATVTLPGAVTATIDNCDSAWTASANVTATASGTQKMEGTNGAQLAIAAGFTTGKVAYRATGTLDLSAYQQVSFWFASGGQASTYELRLCSDTTGDTAVHTIPLPATSSGVFTAYTWDNGAALSSSIQSVSLWCTADPGTATVRLDNIIACKASSSADSLTLSSLIGKVHTLSWEASTAYAADTKRVPTTPNKNGWCYKVTAGGGGSSGSSEPTWPDQEGATVSDGALTWTCFELEDTYYPIRSISGTTVTLDSLVSIATNYRGYAGDTESVATYKREPLFNAGSNTTTDSGTATEPITYSGGWDRTDMTAQTGETWLNGRNGSNVGVSGTAGTGKYHNFHSLKFTRFSSAFQLRSAWVYNLTNCAGVGCTTMFSYAALPIQVSFRGGAACNNATGLVLDGIAANIRQMRIESNSGSGIDVGGSVSAGGGEVVTENCYMRNNLNYGVSVAMGRTHLMLNPLFGNNGSGATFDAVGNLVLVNAGGISNETVSFGTKTVGYDAYTKSWQHNRVADAHSINADGGTIVSATDQRHTASGISWKFSVTSTERGAGFPLRLPIGRIKCTAGVAKSITIWTRRDSTNIKGQLVLRGAQSANLKHQEIDCQPTINTWVESSALAFTPSEDCVVELEFWVYDGVGTTNNFWIDDLTVA